MAINVKDKLVTLESLGVAYSAEQDAREEADQALSTRIDNIVAPEGDPSLTEVSDARVSGSTTYNNLKARLDGDKAVIETEISQLSADLDAIDNQSLKTVVSMSGYKSKITFVEGAYIDTSVDNVADKVSNPETSSTWLYAVVNCSKGDVYIVNGNSGTKPKAYVITDASYNVIERETNVRFSGSVTIPKNGAYLIINRAQSNANNSYKWVDNIGKNRADIESIYGITETLEETVIGHGEEIEQNSADVEYIYNMTGITEFIEFTNGYYINNNIDNVSSSVVNPSSSGSWSYAIVDCSAGDVFFIDANSGTIPKAYAFVDAEYNVLIRGTSARVSGNVTAPTNATKLIINKLVSNTAKSYKGSNKIESAVSDIREIKNINAFYNLNLVMPGKENMAWSWWVYPQVVSFKRVRDKVYWGFTTSDGFIGVASYDVETKAVTKNLLRKSSQKDDHNGSAVYVYDDGTILVAYSSGHGEDEYIRVRVSEVPECVERFKGEVLLKSAGKTTYSQLIYYDGKLYLFYRSASTNWCYRYTADKGATWSNEITLITSDIQYYCIFRETTTPGVIRVCMYSNPTLSDANIRQAFLHLDNGVLYNSDNSSQLGSSGVSKDNVTILIPIDSNYTSQRLLDVAITNIDKPLILHAPFTGSNSIYRVYDSGVETDIVIGGTPLITSYLLGASWIGTDKIVACHGGSGNDIVTLYDYGSNTISKDSDIHTEARGTTPIRNARPIIDVNSKYLLWQRGYYGSSYRDFNMDAMIYDLQS